MKSNPRWWVVGLVFSLIFLAVLFMALLVAIILGINIAWWLPELIPAPAASDVPPTSTMSAQQVTASPGMPSKTLSATLSATQPAAASTHTPNQTTREPSTLGTPNPWHLIFEARFTGAESLSGGWNQLSAGQASFLTYRSRPALRISYEVPISIESEDALTGVQPTDSDAQIEVSLALQDNAAAVVDLRCRAKDLTDGYALRLTRQGWQLLRLSETTEDVLASGMPTEGFAGGGWGTYRLGCVGAALFVWDDSGLIAEVKDDTYSTGGSRMVFLPQAQAVRSTVLLAWQRVFVR